jgi:hypothetical protein
MGKTKQPASDAHESRFGEAKKNDAGKIDLSLMPLVAIEAACEAFMVGEAKYDRYNYYAGLEAKRLIRALVNHAYQWYEGEERCSVDGQPHLGSVIACAAMLLQMQKLGTLVDDRYSPCKDASYSPSKDASYSPSKDARYSPREDDVAATVETKPVAPPQVEKPFEVGDEIYCYRKGMFGKIIEDYGSHMLARLVNGNLYNYYKDGRFCGYDEKMVHAHTVMSLIKIKNGG